MVKNRKLAVSLLAMLAVIGLASACTPPAEGGGLPTTNWSFKGTTVRVDDSQDAVDVPLIGCVVNCKDEPYLLNVAFRVKIGVHGSAQAWAVNNRTSAPEDVAAGQTVNAGAGGSPVIFNGVAPVDLLDLANTNNHLEVMGTYVWASEEDQVGNGLAADSLADLLEDALNATLATADLSSLDANFILDLVFSNIGNALGIAVQNIPLFGLGDDLMGGALYIGLGAHGTLGSLLDAVIGDTPFPAVDIPIVEIPPSIEGGGFYTMTGSKSWTRSFHGGCDIFGGNCGQHTWTMVAGPA